MRRSGFSRSRSADAAAPGLPGGRSLAVWTLLLLALLHAGGLAAQMSIQPVIVEMWVEGTAGGSAISVRNDGAEPMAMHVYASDFDQLIDGGHTFLRQGEHERSCAERLQFFPESFELEPGRSQEIRLTMAPGDRTCWSLVFVQTVPRDTAGISVAQRIGVKVYGVRPGAATEGELRSVSLEAAAGSGPGMLLRLEFENRGEDPLRPEGELEIRTLDGNVVGVAPIPAFSVLPGRARRTEVSLELDLPPGEYLAIPILDFGGEYLAGGQTVFRVPEG